MTKPIYVLVTYHHKEDEFPQVDGLFHSMTDAVNAANEIAPQSTILDWSITPARKGEWELYSIDKSGTRYTISEREVTSWVNWKRP